MTSPRPSARERANRANAKKSTGPRTREGKAHAGRNALVHGLARPTPASPGVEALAEALLQDAALDRTPALASAAREFAHAQLSLLEVRAVRRVYWRRLAATTPERAAQTVAGPSRIPAADGAGRLAGLLEVVATRKTRRGEPLKTLESLERYERRALAWRKWAARAFSDAVAVACAARVAAGSRD